MIDRLLATILGAANACPPDDRDRFYAIKDRILRRRGTPDGEEVQRIRRECWACGGEGWQADYYGEGDECWKCAGTGTFRTDYYRLERWRLGGRVFHRPNGRFEGKGAIEAIVSPLGPFGRPVIDGLVEHRRPKGFRAREAALWLALLFDRPYFLRLMLGGWTRGLTLCPLVLIQRLVAPACLRLGVTHRAMIDGPPARRSP
jgi:hypothetical protein